MVLTRLIGVVFAGALIFSATAAADVVVRIRPPHVLVEQRPSRPSRDHVLGIWFPPLGWQHLRLERGKVGAASTAACPLGSASLGPQGGG